MFTVHGFSRGRDKEVTLLSGSQCGQHSPDASAARRVGCCPQVAVARGAGRSWHLRPSHPSSQGGWVSWAAAYHRSMERLWGDCCVLRRRCWHGALFAKQFSVTFKFGDTWYKFLNA